MANGDKLLEKHITEGAGNAQYTSKFAVASLIEAIATWINEQLFISLRGRAHFFLFWLMNVKTSPHRKSFLYVAGG